MHICKKILVSYIIVIIIMQCVDYKKHGIYACSDSVLLYQLNKKNI